MISLLGILLLTYVAAIAETAFVPTLAVYHAVPNVLALLGILWAASAGSSQLRIIEGASIGLVFDLNSGSHVGVGVVAFALLAFAVIQARAAIRCLGIVQQSMVCAPLVAGMMLIVAMGNRLFGEAVPPLSVVLWGAATTAVYSAAVSLPIWMMVDWTREVRRAASTL
ncbi:MAG TPA: rod shape-determining protein MreD [Pirellulales bacterium]|jgi:rod shape-determining protein MreD